MNSFPDSIDHLVYGTPDLSATIADLERLTGIRATPGGSHPGRGTRNYLMALGPKTYLELLGPDPDQPHPSAPRWMGIDDLKEPKLVRWCASHPNLQALRDRSKESLGDVVLGSRRQTDGRLLSWRLTDPIVVAGDGLLPFFIDWGESLHPADSAAAGVTLIGLRLTHPQPDRIRKDLERFDLDLPVERAARVRIIATLATPKGVVELK
ncbi:VOC family protein [Rhodothermus sp. AH-315-K08]|nr:VOC family protein [Rhodothermus sp. AH-315-K08]